MSKFCSKEINMATFYENILNLSKQFRRMCVIRFFSTLHSAGHSAQVGRTFCALWLESMMENVKIL